MTQASEAFLALDPATAADVLREYQKGWMPSQDWEQGLAKLRRGDFSNQMGRVFSLADVQNAHREFVRLNMPGVEESSVLLNFADPLSPAVKRASKVYLLLRVIFDLPTEASNGDHVSGGKSQFMTAPRFFGSEESIAWPLGWEGQHPHLTAPLFLYHGHSYNAVDDFYHLAQRYEVRAWHGGTWKDKYKLQLVSPDSAKLMSACGYGGAENIDGSRIYPNLGFGGDRDPSEVLGLLHQGTVNANSRDRFDWTPLMFAASTGRLQIARALLAEGARVNDENDRGENPLTMAAERGNVTMVLLLIDNGARTNAHDNTGKTPLMYAAEDGRSEAVRLLLDKGADANARDEQGRTALMYVLQSADDLHIYNPSGALSTTEALIPKSHIDAKTVWGASVMDFANQVKDKTVRQLVQKAAKNR
jgi:ankyrin repeat protein